jgi:hypothetical protein
MASSAMNCSNGFPSGGSTITLGPLGMVAHPTRASSTKDVKMLLPYLNISSLSLIRRNRRRNNLQPALRTLFNIGIVPLGIRTVIPVILFLLLWGRFYIYRLLLLVDDRWCRIVWIVWIVRIGIVRITPPRTPSRSDPDTSTIISRPVIVT